MQPIRASTSLFIDTCDTCDTLLCLVSLWYAVWCLLIPYESLCRCVRPCDAAWGLVILCDAFSDAVWFCVMPCEALRCFVMPCAVVWGLLMLCEALWWYVRPCDTVWYLVKLRWCRLMSCDTQCVSLLRPAMSCDKVLGPCLLCRCWLRNRRSDNNWVTPPLVCVGCAVWCVIDHKFHAVITLFLNRAWYSSLQLHARSHS